MTQMHDSHEDQLTGGKALFERFAGAEISRLERAIASLQVETKAYELLSQLYRHLERGDISRESTEYLPSRGEIPTRDITLFSLPGGLITKVTRDQEGHNTSLEFGHIQDADDTSTRKYVADFSVYTYSDPAFGTIGAADLDTNSINLGVHADMNLPTRGLDDLADELLQL